MCKISNFQFIRLVIICFLPISGSSDDKVRLTDVTALTLRRGQYTTARRSPAVPQLRCVGGSAKGLYEPAVIQCYNRGFDGADMQWECKAEMDEAYQFGMIQISCEGYSYPEDPYILRGSCGLQYELEKTKYYDNRSLKQKNENDESGYSTLFTLVLIACLFYFVYSVWPFSRDGNNRDHFGGSRGWDEGPPRPPGSNDRSAPPPGFKNQSWAAPPSYEESCHSASAGFYQQRNHGNDGPGFFSGLGLGGLAGYLFARNQDSSENNTYRRRDHSFFDNYGGFYDSQTNNNERPSTTRTASGFGGTVRR